MPTTRRVSVSLDTPDERAIEAFADPSRPEHGTMEAWAQENGITVRDDSEAAVLRVLARAGAQALREQALEQGYARLADSYKAESSERRQARDRAIARKASRFAE